MCCAVLAAQGRTSKERRDRKEGAQPVEGAARTHKRRARPVGAVRKHSAAAAGWARQRAQDARALPEAQPYLPRASRTRKDFGAMQTRKTAHSGPAPRRKWPMKDTQPIFTAIQLRRDAPGAIWRPRRKQNEGFLLVAQTMEPSSRDPPGPRHQGYVYSRVGSRSGGRVERAADGVLRPVLGALDAPMLFSHRFRSQQFRWPPTQSFPCIHAYRGPHLQ